MTGQYSKEALRIAGGCLASRGNFPDPFRYKTGDILLLHTRDSLLSWLVMYFTSSVWSHTAVFSEHGQIIDATLVGVAEHPFGDYLDDASYISIRTHKDALTDEQNETIVRFARSQLGADYNWRGVFRLLTSIVLGFHAHYRLRFTADIVGLLSLLSLFGVFIPVIALTGAVLAIIHVAIVILTTPFRRRMRKRLAV